MEPQAEELIKESVNVNYVDTEEVGRGDWWVPMWHLGGAL